MDNSKHIIHLKNLLKANNTCLYHIKITLFGYKNKRYATKNSVKKKKLV